MKKLIILICFFLLSFTTQDPFCNGFELGYCQGWQDIKGEWAMCPIAPICPLPKLNQYEFLDGYNRGFVRGRKDAQL